MKNNRLQIMDLGDSFIFKKNSARRRRRSNGFFCRDSAKFWQKAKQDWQLIIKIDSEYVAKPSRFSRPHWRNKRLRQSWKDPKRTPYCRYVQFRVPIFHYIKHADIFNPLFFIFNAFVLPRFIRKFRYFVHLLQKNEHGDRDWTEIFG